MIIFRGPSAAGEAALPLELAPGTIAAIAAMSHCLPFRVKIVDFTTRYVSNITTKAINRGTALLLHTRCVPAQPVPQPNVPWNAGSPDLRGRHRLDPVNVHARWLSWLER